MPFQKGHKINKGRKFPPKGILPKNWASLYTPTINRKRRDALRGEKSHFWKGGIGGITPENHRIREGIEYRLWREAIFARDNWTCQKTGIKGGKLVVHHIQNFAQFPELRFAIDNGITLSKEAHREFHKKYGNKNNTAKQIEEFISN